MLDIGHMSLTSQNFFKKPPCLRKLNSDFKAARNDHSDSQENQNKRLQINLIKHKKSVIIGKCSFF